jgi:hypothetical protein
MRVVLALFGACQEFTVDKPEPELPQPIGECDFQPPPEESVPVNPLCVPVEPPPGGFRPMVEWGAGRGESCLGAADGRRPRQRRDARGGDQLLGPAPRSAR